MVNNKILLVEDNDDDIELVQLALNTGYVNSQLDVVKDGEEALEYLFCKKRYKDKNCDELPALILLDLNLPKLNGFEVLKEIRANEKTSFLPVTIFTSSSQEKDIVDSYKLRANSYIQKPVDFESFRETIQNLGLYWLILNKKPIDN
ncbi:MAG: response regulator [Bacteroidales bacterium]|jgi:two-component system response regulator|nr:response regulator [Bacteroidales bacterium]